MLFPRFVETGLYFLHVISTTDVGAAFSVHQDLPRVGTEHVLFDYRETILAVFLVRLHCFASGLFPYFLQYINRRD